MTNFDEFFGNDSTGFSSTLDSIAPGTTQAIADNQSSGESWTDTLQKILPTLAATYQQKQILDIQLQRAKSGLPPLDNSQLGVGVSLGLSPQTQGILLIGAALAAFAIFGKRR